MSTIALPNPARAVSADTNASSRGRLRRLFDAFVTQRMHQAERIANARLGAMSDAQLTHLGLSASEIAAVRAGRCIGDVLGTRWCHRHVRTTASPCGRPVAAQT